MYLRLLLLFFLAQNSVARVNCVILYERLGEILTIFPDNIPADVTEIQLGDHAISRVASIQGLENLTAVNLANNSLDEFPDFSNVAATLEVLNLTLNQIREIPSELIVNLHVLTQLCVGDNLLTSLPNFGLLPQPPALSVTVSSTDEFDCDWRMAAVKFAEDAGKVGFGVQAPVCRSPEQLVGVDWGSISVDDMVNIGNVTTVYGRFAPFSGIATMSTYPTVTVVIPDVDGKWCARRCVQETHCIMYALDSSSCALANLTAGPAAAVTSYADWYIKL